MIKSISPHQRPTTASKSPILTSGRLNKPWMQKKNEGFFKNSPNEDIVLAKKPREGKLVSPSMNEFLKNEGDIEVRVGNMPAS